MCRSLNPRKERHPDPSRERALRATCKDLVTGQHRNKKWKFESYWVTTENLNSSLKLQISTASHLSLEEDFDNRLPISG